MTGDEPRVGAPVDCGESGDEPFDLRAVLSDDALLDALGPDCLDDAEVRERFADLQPDALIELLLTVRESAGDADSPEPDGGRSASSGCGGPASRSSRPVCGGAPKHRRARRISLILGAAALVAALLAAGIGARAADPHDALWPVTVILYPHRARSVNAAEQVSRRLDAAAAAMAAGDDRAARIELQAAEGRLARVGAEDGRPALQARHGDLDHALHVAVRTGEDAGTRATTPSTGPPRQGSAPHTLPSALGRGSPPSTFTTGATIPIDRPNLPDVVRASGRRSVRTRPVPLPVVPSGSQQGSRPSAPLRHRPSWRDRPAEQRALPTGDAGPTGPAPGRLRAATGSRAQAASAA
ncbi:hypothetical protein [Pseudonocardia sp.]|jgi:hypothetical protein|uniref:hypothetical protein n=1 Tax=Pseudonocardia sp. TaxID=60912 RepID=UPI0031FC8FE7